MYLREDHHHTAHWHTHHHAQSAALVAHVEAGFQRALDALRARNIAYDPRDLENADEDQRQGGRAPKLTIMEEVLLLGLKDKQVRSPFLLLATTLRTALVLRNGVSQHHASVSVPSLAIPSVKCTFDR